MQEIDYSKYGAVPVNVNSKPVEIDYSKYGAVPVESVRQPSVAERIAQSAPVQFTLGAGDALHNLLTLGKHGVNHGEGGWYTGGNIAGNIGAFTGLSGPAFAARGALEAAPLIGKAASYMGRSGLAPTMARLGAGGAAYEGATHGDNRLLGVTFGGVGGALGGGLAHAISALRPTRLFKSNLSEEELRRNAQIAGQTATGLGDVIESPTMKHVLENVSGRNPFSGYDQKTAGTAETIANQGNSILGKYLGETSPLQVDEKIKEGLLNAYKNQRNAKNALYEEANKLADESGVSVTPKNFVNSSKDEKDLLQSQEFLKQEPGNKKLISKLSNYGEGPKSVRDLATYKESLVYPEMSLTEANVLAGKLGDLAKKNMASKDTRYHGQVLSNLARSLKSDIRESIENSGNSQLKQAFESAESNYKNNFSQYLDKDIYNFIGKDKSEEDIVSTFLKTGRNTDKGRHLDKLISKLDPETQNLFKYSYLSRAIEGEKGFEKVNPSRFATLLSKNNLGPKQKSVLFRPEERSQLDEYSKLVKMNPEALSRMFNPKTGQRNLEHLGAVSHSIASGLGGGVGGVAGYKEGGIPGAMTGALLGIGGGLVLPSMISKHIVSKLTSPEYREKFVEQLIKNRKNENSNTLRNIVGKKIPAVSASLGSQLFGTLAGG